MSDLNRAELCDLLLSIHRDMAGILQDVFVLSADELSERLRGTSAELDQVAANAMKKLIGSSHRPELS